MTAERAAEIEFEEFELDSELALLLAAPAKTDPCMIVDPIALFGMQAEAVETGGLAGTGAPAYA